MKNIIYCISIIFAVLISTNYANAERGISLQAKRKNYRAALIIGNSNYKDSPLKNSANDARDMTSILKGVGFDVTIKINASQREMENAVRQFGKKIRQGGAGLFYYAGHGIQVNGRNYLIPIDATIESEADVKYEAVDAGLVLGKMEDAGNDLNIVILDACRNNPFARSFRSNIKGLARMDAPKGSIVAYATAPGSVAADGNQRNGIYTKHLMKNMKKPGLTIEQVLKQVRVAVARETANKQIPWESSSLMGNFYFQSEKNEINYVSKPQSISQQVDDEEEMWIIVKKSNNIDDFKSFLSIYPKSRFVKHATLRLNQLNRPLQKDKLSPRKDNKTSQVATNINNNKLAFFDDFEGHALNNSKWQIITRKNGQPHSGSKIAPSSQVSYNNSRSLHVQATDSVSNAYFKTKNKLNMEHATIDFYLYINSDGDNKGRNGLTLYDINGNKIGLLNFYLLYHNPSPDPLTWNTDRSHDVIKPPYYFTLDTWHHIQCIYTSKKKELKINIDDGDYITTVQTNSFAGNLGYISLYASKQYKQYQNAYYDNFKIISN